MNSSASVLVQRKTAKINVPQIIDLAVLGSFVVSIVWLIFQMAQGNMGVAGNELEPARDY